MANTTSNTQLVDTLTEVFLTWMQNDIIPFCVTAIDILIIIVGMILNTILLVTFKRRGLMNEASTYFVLILAIVDFIAYALILIPTIITAIAAEWLLSDPVCQIHGAVITLLMFANFIFLSVLAVERGLKLCNVERHEKVFENRTRVNIIISLVWTVSGVLAFLPVSGLGGSNIKYEFYHQGCMLDYEASPVFLLVNFVLTFVASVIIFSFWYGRIFNVRRHAIMTNRNSTFTKQTHPSKRNTSSGVENALPVIDENDERTNSAFVKTELDKKEQTKSQAKSTQGKVTRKRRPEPPTGISMLFEIFSDDHENPAFHLAVTYISLWACILLCYLPYFTLAFYDTFNDGGVWRGLYSVTLLISHASFIVKPFIYLGHNRHYRSVTKETVPEAVKKTVRSVRSSISGVAGKFEDFMFRSPAKSSFGDVIATNKAILIWKTRMKMKQHNVKGSNNMIKDLPTKPAEIESSIQNKQAEGMNKTEKIVTLQVEGRENVRSQPTSPSGVNITTSSFIENERHKLTGNMTMHKPLSNTETMQTALSPAYTSTSYLETPDITSPSSDKELPGMIGGNNVTDNRSNSISPQYGAQSDQLRLI